MAAAFLGRVDDWDRALGAIETTGETRVLVARARGRLFERAGRLGEAEARHREAVALAPADVEARKDLARVLVNRASTDDGAALEAANLYLALLRDAPSDDVVRQGLDWLAQREASLAPREIPDTTRLDRAVAWLRALAESDPENPVAWAQLGVALRLQGDGKGAVAAYDRAIAVNPYDMGLVNDRAIAQLAAGDRDGALQGFEKAAAADRNETSPRQNAGRLHRLAGDAEGAARHWSGALAATRTVGGSPLLYRSLLDRLWRDRAQGSR
jgi:tetratricopeptide (TPR) repeat protein